MVVLSLFNGMSCGEIALRMEGIKIDKYYSSEIDKYAITQTQLNFPDTIQLGSVVDVDVSKLAPIDLLIGGSPCQSFSFAGKRKGMATKCEIQITKLEQYLELKEQGFEFEGQSYLFWEYMRILTDIRKYNPDVKFLLENVEMGAKWERILSEAIGIFGVHINSNLVSAQNRARIYWTNIKVEKRGMFEELYSGIPQPKDMGILLKDILESEVDEKFYLSDKMLNYFDKRAANFNNGKVNIRDEEGKATTLTASMSSCDISDNFIKATKNGISKDQTKSSTLMCPGHGSGIHSDMDIICVAQRGRGENNEQQLEPNITGKTNCLTSVAKDNLVMQINPSLESGGKQPYQHNRVYDTEGISPCLNTDARAPAVMLKVGNIYPSGGENGNIFSVEGKSPTIKSGETSTKGNGGVGSNNAPKVLNSQSRIRRLTPSECARLQTIPDWYKWECSDTQIYRMCGNGWTCAVIAHIFSFLNN